MAQELPEEVQRVADEVPFETIEPIEFGSLDDVKDEAPLIPPTRGVKVIIKRVDNIVSKDEKWRGLRLGMQLTEGIETDGNVKWKNSYVNSDSICYYADLEKYTKDFFKEKRHLSDLKRLLKATGSTAKKVDDEFISSLKGTEISVDIMQEDNEYTTANGEEIKEKRNIARNYKAASI